MPARRLSLERSEPQRVSRVARQGEVNKAIAQPADAVKEQNRSARGRIGVRRMVL